MRTYLLGVLLLGGWLLISCSNSQQQNRNEPSAREAGREAYRATEDLKHDAQKAERELRDAGNQFKNGWNQAKHQNHEQDNGPHDEDKRQQAGQQMKGI
jgi:hypothetical protein